MQAGLEDRRMPSINGERAWQAVLKRDRRRDGDFVYAVASTGIYCRPSCPARRPARRRVTFFDSPQAAEAAGFRACRRCRPSSPQGSASAQRLERARRRLDRDEAGSLTLRRLAAEVGGSPYHLQRAFKRAFGLSPKEYRDARRVTRLKAALKGGRTVTDAIYEAGLSSGSRLYARVNSDLGMTPVAFRSGGAGLTLRFATERTAIGRMLVAITERGIAAVRLGQADAGLLASLRRDYPRAVLRRDAVALTPYVAGVLRCLSRSDGAPRLPLDFNALHATAFQRRVWKALQAVPCGQTRSYRDLARAIGKPTAARAVARACAANALAIAIPCHRVVRANGDLAGYRWGIARKKRLLKLEQQQDSAS